MTVISPAGLSRRDSTPCDCHHMTVISPTGPLPLPTWLSSPLQDCPGETVHQLQCCDLPDYYYRSVKSLKTATTGQSPPKSQIIEVTFVSIIVAFHSFLAWFGLVWFCLVWFGLDAKTTYKCPPQRLWHVWILLGNSHRLPGTWRRLWCETLFYMLGLFRSLNLRNGW